MASTSPPIKTDLFRFVTLRSPEVFTEPERERRFVSHPKLSESAAVTSCPVPPATGILAPAVLAEFIQDFPVFADKAAISVAYPDLYAAAQKKKILIEDVLSDNPSGATVRYLSDAQEFTLFEALIGELVSRKSKNVRQTIAQMLIVNHVYKYGSKLYEVGLKKMIDIKIEVPFQVIECYKRWRFGTCGGTLEGVQNLGIADFRRVEQEVCCYLPGEVSHIENIMAKEYKERSTRNFIRTENTIETSRETEAENISDVTTATRNEMSSEVAQVLEAEKSANYGGSLGVSGVTPSSIKIDVNAYADFATSSSSSYANTAAKTYAEEVTKRALERIVQKTSEKRTSKVIKEFEENNKHGFDNRLGDKHITGVYRWVDIIYTNRLINYGKRLMVELMVPEPAEFYKRILRYKHTDSGSESSTFEPPKPPTKLGSFGIYKASDITPSNAFEAASYYGVQITPLPPNQTALTRDLSPLAPVSHNRNITTQSLAAMNIPSDYELDTVVGSYTYEFRAGSAISSQQAFCDFTFGNYSALSGGNYSGTKQSKKVNVNADIIPNLSGSVPISVAYSGCHGLYGAVVFNCILKASVTKDWQNDSYNKLLAGYNAKLDAHNQEAQDSTTAQEEEVRASNPAMNRIIEQRELKRICIEMLIKPYCWVQGKENTVDLNPCDNIYQIPQVAQTAAFSEYAAMVKFFEQAIDWQIMSYLFYPYYWAGKCDWGDLMKSESDDMIFQAFLQSGMARVVIPIRQQFTEAFAYYLETGEI
jgi:hypothetical protein